MQSIPLAVLKLPIKVTLRANHLELHAIHTACGIETLEYYEHNESFRYNCMQSIPLAVLKQKERVLRLSPFAVPAFLCNIYKKSRASVG